MKYQNRIVEYRVVKASELRANPRNWRDHPPSQREALEATLEEVGVAGVATAFVAEDGQLELIDGHLRAEVFGDEEIGVLVTDMDRDEAEKALLTMDPLALMATPNEEMLAELIGDAEFEHASLRRMLDDMDPDLESLDEMLAETSSRKASGMVSVEDMELHPEEHYDFVLVLADNVNDWNRLVALLDLPDVKLSRTHRRIGIGRACRASQILSLIEGKDGDENSGPESGASSVDAEAAEPPAQRNRNSKRKRN